MDQEIDRLLGEAFLLDAWLNMETPELTEALRNRIKTLKHISGRDLRPHPRNHNRHPEEQVHALAGLLREVGIAGALLVYEADDGVMTVIDGECRAVNFADQEWPCLVLDVDDREAEILLAAYDHVGRLSKPDQEALRALLADLNIADPQLHEALADLEDRLQGELAQVGPNITADAHEVAERIPALVFGKYRFPLTQESVDALESKIVQWRETHGTMSGLGDALVRGL